MPVQQQHIAHMNNMMRGGILPPPPLMQPTPMRAMNQMPMMRAAFPMQPMVNPPMMVQHPHGRQPAPGHQPDPSRGRPGGLHRH
jgi:hypothetical protein